jgi:hypothetical protein
MNPRRFQDANQDGYFETVALDADRDGRPERLFYDGDRDGYPEWQSLDLVGPDALADTWVDARVPSGNLQQDRAANDLMVQNIVRLNQLRQLDPWSTGYIPYSAAPSLLRPYDRPEGDPIHRSPCPRPDAERRRHDNPRGPRRTGAGTPALGTCQTPPPPGPARTIRSVAGWPPAPWTA